LPSRRSKALGGPASAIAADVRDEASCKAAVDAAAERFGKIDILANDAGFGIRKKPKTFSMAEWHAVVDTNLTTFILSQLAHPLMKQSGGGKIINVGAMTAEKADLDPSARRTAFLRQLPASPISRSTPPPAPRVNRR
jgi:2-dehydro-3-deoxy-D-gluconate 5-dehydrogenase